MARKILLVEDNDLFRKTVKRIICSRFPGLEIEETADAQEALRKVTIFHPDHIFMDIRIPGGDGIELTARIKSAYPHIRVVMLSNLDSPAYREAAFEAGADGFISKRKAVLDSVCEALAHTNDADPQSIENRIRPGKDPRP
jgi:DNA-binding NarL/FixJ family response regulator